MKTKEESAGDRIQSMNTNQWISRQEREPVESDFPVAFGGYGKSGWFTGENWFHVGTGCKEYTHWISQKLPPPPPREKTLEEEDCHAFYDWKNKTEYETPRRAFLAALIYERAEIAKICGEEKPDSDTLLAKIYARVKGTK